MRARAQATQPEADEQDDTADQQTTTDAAGAAEVRSAENALTKFDPATLKAMTTSPVMGSGMSAFQPRSMAEAMEFAKLMASSNFVAPHLRGKPGDCLAVVLQAVRWNADAYAVGNKSYFVNNRMAYEAQLVNAVLNTSNVLDGRLQITWQGRGPTLQCTVRGRIKGDDEVHELIQESCTITTKNSPLWKQSERVQLAYYTSRAWGRLFTPEVMLGIYTPDEFEDNRVPAEIVAPAGTQQVIPPPRPTRESVKADKAATERMRKEQVANEAHARTITRETPAHDAETGELAESGMDRPHPDADEHQDDAGGQGDQGHQGDSDDDQDHADTGTSHAAAAKPKDAAAVRQTLMRELINVTDQAAVEKFPKTWAAEIDYLKESAPAEWDKVDKALQGKRMAYAPKKR